MEESTTRQQRLVISATYVSVGVALFLLLVKTTVWLYSGSASLLGSLLDSLMDLMASMVTFLGVRYSLKPADREHRFGHGKAESLAALAQAGFILGSAVLLLLYCVERWLRPEPHVVQYAGFGIAVMVLAIVCTLGLVLFQSYVVRATGSTAIAADQLHYRSDLLLNASVIVALLLARFGYPQADIVLGTGIAFYICRSALLVGTEALNMLMDRELEPEVDRQICELALGHDGVLGVHDLRTRRSGLKYMIQLHLEMADDTLLSEAHDIADEVEAKLLEAFPDADIIIHQDPLSVLSDERRLTSEDPVRSLQEVQ